MRQRGRQRAIGGRRTSLPRDGMPRRQGSHAGKGGKNRGVEATPTPGKEDARGLGPSIDTVDSNNKILGKCQIASWEGADALELSSKNKRKWGPLVKEATKMKIFRTPRSRTEIARWK